MARLLVVTNYAPFQRLGNERAELKSVRKVNGHLVVICSMEPR